MERPTERRFNFVQSGFFPPRTWLAVLLLLLLLPLHRTRNTTIENNAIQFLGSSLNHDLHCDIWSFTAVKIQVKVFCVETLCSVVEGWVHPKDGDSVAHHNTTRRHNPKDLDLDIIYILFSNKVSSLVTEVLHIVTKRGVSHFVGLLSIWYCQHNFITQHEMGGTLGAPDENHKFKTCSFAVKIQVAVFRAVTPCSDVIGYQGLGGPCYLQKTAT